MCQICKDVLSSSGAENSTAVLDKIASAIEGGVSASHFFEALDKLLGTKIAEKDLEIESTWENRYRGNKS